MAEQITRRPFTREVSRTRWYFRHPRYLRYMAREVTCIFIAVYTVLLVVGCIRLSQGREAYEAFLLALASPVSIAFHLLAFGFAAYHSVTWFNLAPKAMPLHLGERPVSPGYVAGAHYIAWGAISVAILALAGVF